MKQNLLSKLFLYEELKIVQFEKWLILTSKNKREKFTKWRHALK